MRDITGFIAFLLSDSCSLEKGLRKAVLYILEILITLNLAAALSGFTKRAAIFAKGFVVSIAEKSVNMTQSLRSLAAPIRPCHLILPQPGDQDFGSKYKFEGLW